MDELPKGWAEVTIQDVAEVNPRKSVNLSPDDLVTFIPMAAVDEVSGTIASSSIRPLSEVNKGFTQFSENDVIFAKITPSMENGKSAVATGLANGIGFGSTEFHVFRSTGAVLPEFLWRFVRQQEFRDNAQKVMSGAVGQQRVPAEFLKGYAFLLPPLSEQKRIVKKIAQLTDRIARARTDLAHVPGLVAKYRSTVLELAFSGKLTADMRNEKETHTGALPHNWEVKLLGDISDIQGGIQVGKKRNAQVDLIEVPYLRVANVQRGWLNLDDVKTITVTPAERDRLTLKKGDVLMNEGGDRDKLGRGWIWDEQIPDCIHQNHVFRIRLNENALPPEFVSHYANERGQQYFIDQGTQTTNLASISKRKVAALPIPVPPFDEALEIVRRIRAAFYLLNQISADHSSASKLLPKLDAAILAKAFRGLLVPQNTKDESAELLLARIREAREMQAAEETKHYPHAKKDRAMSLSSKELVLQDSRSWPENGLPFEEIAKRIVLSHDEIRDVIFALLGDQPPKLRQVFNTEAKCMFLKRVSK